MDEDLQFELKLDIVECIYRQERCDVIFRNTQRKAWTRQALEAALSRILRQNEFPLEITLFLDALDEYDGRPELITEFLAANMSQASRSEKLRGILDALPDQLSDYYINIVRRIPQAFLRDTYVLPECVSRAE
jgi:hypothetical protein